MPVVVVNMWEGRDREAKRRIAQGITDVFTREGVPPDATHVVMNEVPKENWAIAGRLCSD